MISDEELRDRERSRRQAFWELANILPGDPRAVSALTILDEIEQLERLASESKEQPLSVGEVQRLVPIEPHSIGCAIVREANIPQPWRERFLLASIGSTRVAEGAYAHDWEQFLAGWQNETRHLEKHRAASVKKS
ncbi:hypothetical protein DM828_21605 [Pseudomonas umsongensis]|nr:hypothetical protein [Pseudomonas umsongensis]